MKTYIAKGPHKRSCDLCGEKIEPGDRVETWCYVGEDGPASSNIMRVHATCHAISNRDGIDEWTLRHAFEERGEFPTEWIPTMRKLEARRALRAARSGELVL